MTNEKFMTNEEREYRKRMRRTYKMYLRLIADGCPERKVVAQIAAKTGQAKHTVYNHLAIMKEENE